MGGLLNRWRWSLGVAGLLLLGLVYAFWPRAMLVDAGTVTRGEMAVGVTDDGVTRAQDHYIVSAPVTGYLSRITLKAGDAVQQGQLIGRMGGRPSPPLDPRSTAELQAALASARAGAASAQASLAQARQDRARAEELASRGFLPQAQLEVARTRVATGEAALAGAQADVARISALLSPPAASGTAPVALRAPASGRVLEIITESEGVVAEGTAIMTIGDPARIEVVVDLLSREAVRVSPGDLVEITQWGGPDPLSGRVHKVEPFGQLKISALGIEEQRVNVIIRFDEKHAAAAARLGHGYQVDATIIRWHRDDALRVPIGALFRGSDGGWRVFAIRRGRAREQAITLGQINDRFGEVTAGLEAGESVVLNPPNALKDGTRVRMR